MNSFFSKLKMDKLEFRASLKFSQSQTYLKGTHGISDGLNKYNRCTSSKETSISKLCSKCILNWKELVLMRKALYLKIILIMLQDILSKNYRT